MMRSSQPVILVGDAKAFWYAVPMKRLRYQTVFDVREWEIEKAGLFVIDPGEIERFRRTYKGLPELPQWMRGIDKPTVVER